MLNPPAPGLITLSIVTVTSHDLERFKSTAETMNWSSGMSVEWIVVLPQHDLPTRRYIDSLQSNSKLRVVDDLGDGIYEAMNLGLRSARGEYVSFLNSGDLVSSLDLLAQLVDFLKAKKREIVIVDVEIPWRKPQLISMDSFQNFTQFKVNSFISHQSIIIRTALLLDMGGFDLRYRVAADTDLIIRVAQYGQTSFFDRKVFFVEQPNFASQRNRRARAEVIMIAFLTSRGISRIRIPLNLILRELKAVPQRFIR
jgi:hypothetical protein